MRVSELIAHFPFQHGGASLLVMDCFLFVVLSFKVYGILPSEENWFSSSPYSVRGETAYAPPYDIFCNMPLNVVVNGSLYWIANRGILGTSDFWEISPLSLFDTVDDLAINSIMVFDIVEEVFREKMLPKILVSIATRNLCLKAIGDSLSVIQYEKLCKLHSVWVMKEYGAVESWSKKFSYDFELGFGRIWILGRMAKCWCPEPDPSASRQNNWYQSSMADPRTCEAIPVAELGGANHVDRCPVSAPGLTRVPVGTTIGIKTQWQIHELVKQYCVPVAGLGGAYGGVRIGEVGGKVTTAYVHQGGAVKVVVQVLRVKRTSPLNIEIDKACTNSSHYCDADV
ncbi:hypothetical protein LguiA_022055 [Lonicera macranthoides]